MLVASLAQNSITVMPNFSLATTRVASMTSPLEPTREGVTRPGMMVKAEIARAPPNRQSQGWHQAASMCHVARILHAGPPCSLSLFRISLFRPCVPIFSFLIILSMLAITILVVRIGRIGTTSVIILPFVQPTRVSPRQVGHCVPLATESTEILSTRGVTIGAKLYAH